MSRNDRLASLKNSLRRLPLTVSVVSRMASEDPLLFAVQSLRKAPRNIRHHASRLIPKNSTNPGIRALRPFLLDHRTDAARSLTEGAASESTDKLHHASRLADELLVQLGHPVHDAGDVRTTARSAWESGDLDLLASLPTSGRQKQRYEGELKILRPGWGISLPTVEIDSKLSRVASHAQGSKLRALHILTNSLPWTRSGYTYRTQNLLKALQDTGVEVLGVTRIAYPTVIGALSANKVDIVDGVPYERLFPSSWPADPSMRLVRQTQMLLPIVERFRPNVLHTTTNYQNALVTDAVSRATGIPWIYEMRGNMEQTWIARKPDELQDAAKSSKRYELMRARETEMASQANHVIVLSNIQKEDLISRGISAQKITVIPNSADEALLSVAREPKRARHQLSLPEDGFWVGSVTSVVDYEGLPTLVDAVGQMRDSGIDVRCAIVGDGVALPDLREQIRDLDLGDRILTPGRVSRDQALLWYQALDVFVIPRIDTEVTRTITPIKGLEAQALGVPVVVSDLPPLREASTEAVETFSPGNAHELASKLADFSHCEMPRETLEHTARSFAKTRSWSVSAKAITTLYCTIVQANNGERSQPYRTSNQECL